MPSTCGICKTTHVSGSEQVLKYAVPLDPVRRQRWEQICGLKFSAFAKLCEKHFAPSDFSEAVGVKRRRLKSGSVPTLFLPPLTSFEPNESNSSIAHMENMAEEEHFKMDCGTQTEYESVEAGTIIENRILKKKIEELQAENSRLKEQLADIESLHANLKNIFTAGQMKRLCNPNIHTKWCWDDISAAITLHAAGPRAYRHLKEKGLPLPCLSTLHSWVQKVGFGEGILDQIIGLLKHIKEIPPEDRLCIISFDEMKVAACYEHDTFTGCIRKPSNFVQVAIVRGIKASWKQPIFYGFDQKMTKALLYQLLTQLYEAGYTVVGMVSDMGSTNQALWRELNVSMDQTWFQHPSSCKEKVFVFADVPHLLKLVRNHFIDSGFVFEGKIITAQTVKQLMNITSTSDTSIAFKLSEEHLNVSNAGRQKVKLAAQLMSNTTASAIRRCYSIGHAMYNPCECADFIQLVNDWFDIFNSKLSTANNIETKKPYGLALPCQSLILNRMSKVMSQNIIPNKKTLAPFQKGIIMSNQSLVFLYDYLKKKFGFDYLITYRLNQDVLENFFGNIRSRGGLYDHPSPMQFKYRLRKYLFARNTEILKTKLNVEVDDTPWLDLSSATALQVNSLEEATISQALCQEFLNEDFSEPVIEHDISEVQEDALEFLSGYIIRKLTIRNEFEDTDSATFTWVDQVSQGGLCKSKSQFLEEIKKLEDIFYMYNGTEISPAQHLVDVMLRAVQNATLPENVIKFFFKSRINFRLRDLNKKMREHKINQRLGNNKKMRKILT